MNEHSFDHLHQVFAHAQSVALIANGAIQDYALMQSLIIPYQACVAVDGGLVHCHHMHIRPDLIIGDFDSIDPHLLAQYPDVLIEPFPTDKDQTDLELGVHAVNTAHVTKIGLFGVLEKRTDHALGNLHLMRRFADKAVIETEYETIFSIHGTKQVPCYPGQVVSLIPIGPPPIGVTSQGLKWELHNATLDQNFMSISNICLRSTFQITIREGDLLCCLLRKTF